MSYQKNDVLTVKIEDMGHDGEGIGKCEGYTLFVKDTVIGDLAEVKVIKAKKNYGYARLMRLIEPSAHRVEPVCPVARPCGGCPLQMPYSPISTVMAPALEPLATIRVLSTPHADAWSQT